MTEPVLCENLSKKLQPKQKEFYESLIQRCDSDDPLGDWYEYLTWAEENYLKDKREYTQLLQRCLVKFRHEKQYHQDTRYVALWVKQIKSSSRSLELFKKCLESGIGKHNALMYIAWSHDLEINKDVKGAHRILKEALNCNAQPKVLLEKAQQNFIIRMGRSMFEDIDLESVKAEQMMMVEQLLLYENKINVGKKINHASSGVLQPMSPNTNHQSNVSASPLIIFNEEDKENPIKDINSKPGIWTGTTGQQLHKELKAKYICNPYKAKSKPVDDFSCALAMFEPVDPTKRVMYCKSKVYTEFSFEELRAIAYLKGYRRPRRKRDNEQVESENMHEDCNGMETARQELDSPNCPVAMFEPPGPTHFMCTSKVFANGLECSVEELRAKKYLKDNMPRTCNKILDVKPEDVESVPANKGIFHKPRIFDLLLNEPDISLSIKDTKNKEDAQSNESQDLASLSALCSNSITCNTREAINVVQNCWSSADDCQCLGIPAKKNNLLNNRYESPDSVKKAVPFEVYVDEKAHCNLVKNNVPFEVFEDVTGQLEVPDLKKKNVPFEVFEDVTGQLKLPDSKKKDVPFEVLNEKENFPFEVLEDGTDYLEQKKGVQPIKHIEAHAFTTSSNEEANRAINSITDHNQIKMKDELNVFEIEGVIPVEDENDSNGFGYLLKKLLGSENQNSKQENVRISDGSSLGSAAVGIDGFLPCVPSPGLTEEEELALKGTETKENKPPEDFVPPPSENRVMMGVLQPTDRFPSNPLDDPALQQDVPEDKDYTSCTTAFSYPLVSSTPFTDHLKPVCLSSETDARQEENNLHLNALSRTNEAAPCVNPVNNLSKIVESTFEQYRISSGGSNASTSKSYSGESRGTMTQTTYAEQKKVIGSRSNRKMNESGRGMRFMHTNPQMKVLLQDGLVEQNCISVKYVEHKSENEAVTNKSSVHIVNCSKELEELIIQKQPQSHSLDNEIESDPFDANVIQKLQNDTDFPSVISSDRLKILDVPVPRFRIGDTVSLGFLPYVPSPGLTEEEELALKGTETKNKPLEDFVPPPSENRLMMGVLQPTDRFPSNPLDDPALQQDVPEDKDYTSCTTAFSYPLVSSTPFTDHLKPVCLSSETDARQEENNLHLNALSRTNEAVAYVNPVSNLSKIESTFEQYRISSEGSNASTSKSYSVESSGTMTQTTYAEQKKVIGSRSNSEMNESGRGMRFMYTNPQMKVLQDGLVEQNCVSVKYVEHKSESEAVTNKSSVHIVNCSKELELIMQKQPQPHSLDNEIEIDPFDANVIQKLLNNTDFSSGISPDRLKILDVPVPRFRIGDTVSLECDKFKIDRVLGEGNYAKVFKGIDLTSEKIVALKMQKPSWIWEFYICEQIRKRLNDPLRGLAFMNIERAYIFNNGSVMLTDFAQMGSLLNLINIVKQERTRFPEELMLCWMVELLNIAEGLQSCKIIHGDIKPDNIVVRMIPKSGCAEPTLQLIDMGRGIDMTLFPDGTTFNRVVSTQAFQCVEMQTKCPWTYQTDLYGIAACMYCMIFLDYMKVVQKNKKWVILRMVPRYNKFKSILEWFFHTLLNIESCDRMPDLLDLKQLAAKEMRGAVQRNPNSCAKFLERFHLIK